MYADGNMLKIKHDVLYEVAKLAFAGELEEKRDNIAMELIPGPTPSSAAVFTRSGRLSARGCAWRRARRPARRMTAM